MNFFQTKYRKAEKMNEFENPNAIFDIEIECGEGHTHSWSMKNLIETNKKLNIENSKLRESDRAVMLPTQGDLKFYNL